MTADVTKLSKAARNELARLTDVAEKRRKALEDTVTLTASVLSLAVGKDAAVDFMAHKIAPLDDSTCRFYGPDGIEAARIETADGISTGWAIGPAGATFGIKATSGGNAIVIQLSAAELAILAEETTHALAAYRDAEGSILHHTGGPIDKMYQAMLSNLAHDHLALSEKKAEIYRDARAEADLTIHAHAAAATAKAMAAAERKVEGIVRRLATAAAMPNGMEKHLALEESIGMVRRAFGGE